MPEVRRRLTDWQGLLSQETGQARMYAGPGKPRAA
jgi:hypothetical protein